MATPTPIEDLLSPDLRTSNNTIRTYYALDQAMMTAHREDRDDYAISTARELLHHPDLPLLIRARACMIIGCSNEPDFLELAKEAVRVANLGYKLCSNPGDVEKRLVDSAQECLEGAQKAQQAIEDEADDDGDGELVYQYKDDGTVEYFGSTLEEVQKEKKIAEEGEAQHADQITVKYSDGSLGKMQVGMNLADAGKAEASGGKKKVRKPRMHTDENRLTVVGDDPPPPPSKRTERQGDQSGDGGKGKEKDPDAMEE